jgi:hypothetical protein
MCVCEWERGRERDCVCVCGGRGGEGWFHLSFPPHDAWTTKAGCTHDKMCRSRPADHRQRCVYSLTCGQRSCHTGPSKYTDRRQTGHTTSAHRQTTQARGCLCKRVSAVDRINPRHKTDPPSFHKLTHSLTHALTHSRTHALTHSLTHLGSTCGPYMMGPCAFFGSCTSA